MNDSSQDHRRHVLVLSQSWAASEESYRDRLTAEIAQYLRYNELMNEAALLDKLAGLEERYDALSVLLADPDVLAVQSSLQTLAREQANLEPTVSKVRTFRRLQQELEEARALAHDADPLMAQLGEEEMQRLEPQQLALWQQLELALLPNDPHDERDVFIEIRAGAGGDEAALFAADLFRMYTRYALAKGWQAGLASYFAEVR